MTRNLVQHCPVMMPRVAGLEPVLRHIKPVCGDDAAAATVIGGSLGRSVRIVTLDPLPWAGRRTVSPGREV